MTLKAIGGRLVVFVELAHNWNVKNFLLCFPAENNVLLRFCFDEVWNLSRIAELNVPEKVM